MCTSCKILNLTTFDVNLVPDSYFSVTFKHGGFGNIRFNYPRLLKIMLVMSFNYGWWLLKKPFKEVEAVSVQITAFFR